MRRVGSGENKHEIESKKLENGTTFDIVTHPIIHQIGKSLD
jgi:hypothetical protein